MSDTPKAATKHDRCNSKGYVEVERSEAFIEHVPCCPVLEARIDAETERADGLLESLEQCLDALRPFDTTDYDDYGGPHLSAGITKLGERAEKAENANKALSLLPENSGVATLGEAGERIADLEAENTRLLNQLRATRQQAINLGDQLEQRKP